MSVSRSLPRTRLILAPAALLLLTACDDPLDLDLRGNFNNAFNTSDAAKTATAARPKPDDRGIISYPGYQVAIAKRGDTVADVALRVGAEPAELARYNGIKLTDPLRRGEVIALPRRVAEPSPATGSLTTGPIQPPSQVDISELAGGAIDRAGSQQVETTTLPSGETAKIRRGVEPTRHKVTRGETAYTIARLYDVSVRALADWNGLGSDYAIREGQYLLIPVADPTAKPRQAKSTTAAAAVPVPGAGSPSPVPPSAAKPLPQEKTKTAATSKATTPSTAPDLGKTQTKASKTAAMSWPVRGAIIREYAKGKTDGIDISASAGTAVKAAQGGTVAAITSDADQVPIIVVKHPNNLLTVYANVDEITVKKGDSVSRDQKIAKIRAGESSYLHFEVRKGFDSVDPAPYLK